MRAHLPSLLEKEHSSFLTSMKEEKKQEQISKIMNSSKETFDMTDLTQDN
jgi:hypothetical protein